jgi:5-methyltetrahydropteroyltriglutamate--homocysteine methyltransferase
MKAIIIGAGRGSRIMPYSQDRPKCFTEVAGERILDRILGTFSANGIMEVHFIGGYHIGVVEKAYPELTFHVNEDWERNNVLASLFKAEDAMDEGFICCYSDIVFTAEIVEKLLRNPRDIVIGVDTQWRRRYASRTQHPMDDAEKVLVKEGRILKIDRAIPSDEAAGEFIGVAKFTAEGARELRKHYHKARRQFTGMPFRTAAAFEKAYLIHLFQEMIEDGIDLHYEETHGDYYEIDTVQDLKLVEKELRAATLFPTAVIGSMPRAGYVQELLDPESNRNAGSEETQRKVENATRFIIDLQEFAGVDIISDGEWRRLSYIGVIADLLNGFERRLEDGLWWHTVTGKLSYRNEGLFSKEAQFACRNTSASVKVALPSPYLIGSRLWHEERSKRAYPSREKFMRALVPFLKEEMSKLSRTGVSIIQIDDPNLCFFVDPAYRKKFDDPARECQLAVDLINDTVAGVDGVEIAIHLCRSSGTRNRRVARKNKEGFVAEGTYEYILPFLRQLNVHQVFLEFTCPDAGDFSILKELPVNMKIGLGCVSCLPGVVDDAETIVSRVERALEYVDKRRIIVAPDCGFAPGNQADASIDEAYRKLQEMVKAARLLREKYGRHTHEQCPKDGGSYE